MATWNEGMLRKDLEELTASEREELRQHGFDASQLIERFRAAREGRVANRVQGQVRALSEEQLVPLPARGTTEHARLAKRGQEALERGECALAVLSGGMATRMGGVVKALVEAVEGQSFLDLRLAEQEALTRAYGTRPPLWLMTSQPTHAPLLEYLGARFSTSDEKRGFDREIHAFRQDLSVRLSEEGRVFRDENGLVSYYSPGHGDFVDALRRSRLLTKFRARGGKYVLVSNIDNLGGGLDPAVIGFHLEGGVAVTCEVVRKRAADRGGVPVEFEGRPVILEEFRLPADFDPQTIPVFNVNTLAFSAEALEKVEVPWTFFEVIKKVDGAPVLQYERLVHELTFHLPTRYLVVPREGGESRFLPVKDYDELAARQEEIRTLAASRGMIALAP